MSLESLISVARGEAPADLLFTNARIVNTFSGEIESGNVAICQDRIAGVGDYQEARQVIDLKGRYLAPGLIDGHTHLESSYLSVPEYARVVVPRGTTTVMTDLHEIANVAGLRGMRYMLNSARRVPLDLFLMVPPCVPATHLETSGAELTADGMKVALGWRAARGVGEFMNFPGVLFRDPAVLDKLRLAQGRVIDGHAPYLLGRDLNAYLCGGILSDHESTSLQEARQKLSRGMHIMIREGSSEKNLADLLPLVTDKTYKRCFFVVDDRTCVDLLRDGDMDAVVRKAISLGLEPVRAITMASLNAAEYFRLGRIGAVAPGYVANLIALNDLSRFQVAMVFSHGRLVAENGKPLFDVIPLKDEAMTGTMHIKPFDVAALALLARGHTFPVIEVIPGQIVTKRVEMPVKVEGGLIVSDLERDVLKLVVVERHRTTGNIGVGLVRGFRLQRGALATSIAHDSHNVVAVGASDTDIFAAVKEVEALGGGLAAVADGEVLGSLALPIAGLLSEEPLEVVVETLESLQGIARGLGCTLAAPFATLSFLALPVIPELKLTDLGLVDVVAFKLLEV